MAYYHYKTLQTWMEHLKVWSHQQKSPDHHGLCNTVQSVVKTKQNNNKNSHLAYLLRGGTIVSDGIVGVLITVWNVCGTREHVFFLPLVAVKMFCLYVGSADVV